MLNTGPYTGNYRKLGGEVGASNLKFSELFNKQYENAFLSLFH